MSCPTTRLRAALYPPTPAQGTATVALGAGEREGDPEVSGFWCLLCILEA